MLKDTCIVLIHDGRRKGLYHYLVQCKLVHIAMKKHTIMYYTLDSVSLNTEPVTKDLQ